MPTKFFIFTLVFFLCSISKVQAHVFTPASAVFGDARDGAWEFPPAVVRLSPAEQQTRDGDSVQFSFGVPSAVETVGNVSWLSDEGGFLRFNDPAAPQFLVHNRLVWHPQVSKGDELWLRWEYRVWSEESEKGFDMPVLVVYQNNELVYQENIQSPCAIPNCAWRTRRVYLGSVQDSLTLSFLAGDMGDLLKPSGADIRGMKLEKAEAGVKAEAAQPTPSPIAVAAQPDDEPQPANLPQTSASPRSVASTLVAGSSSVTPAVLGAHDLPEPTSDQSRPLVLGAMIVTSCVLIALTWRRLKKGWRK